MMARGFAVRQLASLAFFLVITAQGLHAQCYLHPKLSSGEKTIRSVALLPPTAQMKAQGPRRYDFKEKEAEQLASALAGVVSNALKKRGWDVNDSAFNSQALQDKEELRYLVGYLRARHVMLVQQTKPKDVLKGRYSVRERVAALSAHAPTDVLVLVHGDVERFTTGGVIAATAVGSILYGLGGAITPFFLTGKDVSLRISLVDSHSGEILCFLKVSSSEEEQILKELRKVP